MCLHPPPPAAFCRGYGCAINSPVLYTTGIYLRINAALRRILLNFDALGQLRRNPPNGNLEARHAAAFLLLVSGDGGTGTTTTVGTAAFVRRRHFRRCAALRCCCHFRGEGGRDVLKQRVPREAHGLGHGALSLRGERDAQAVVVRRHHELHVVSSRSVRKSNPACVRRCVRACVRACRGFASTSGIFYVRCFWFIFSLRTDVYLGESPAGVQLMGWRKTGGG